MPAFRLPVRQLVEFLLRTGSIDSRFTGFDRANEGARIHRRLQKAAGEGYAAEVFLSGEREVSGITFTIEGRADGIFSDEAGVTVIDEIKTTAVPADAITEDMNPCHWAQGMVYGALYGRQQGLDRLDVRLTYYQIDTDEVFRFLRHFTLGELEDFLQDLLGQYAPWAQRQLAWKERRSESLSALAFPFPAYRPGQRALAGEVYRACTAAPSKAGVRLFCQAPTGIGKTMSVLFPALRAIGTGCGEKLFYLTARNTTQSAAEDAVARLRAAAPGLALRSVTLTAKEKVCLHPDAEGHPACLPELCPYANGYYDRVNTALKALLDEGSGQTSLLEQAETPTLALPATDYAQDGTVFCKELPSALLAPLRALTAPLQDWLEDDSDDAEGHTALLDLYFEVQDVLRAAERYDEHFATQLTARGSELELQLLCLDPSPFVDTSLSTGRAAALFSATLTPPGYYRTVLGCPEARAVALESPFPPENLGLYCLPFISTRYRQREASIQPISDALAALASGRRGNYLAFFPSYAYLRQVWEDFTARYPGIDTLVQESGLDDAGRAAFLGRFSPCPEKTLLGFGVMGGIFGEGVDLTGDRLIGCAIVGVGLPQVSPRQEMLRRYYDAQNGAGFDYAYRWPGMNKVLQAAGRVIRTQEDKGVVLLLDDRFAQSEYTRLFPRHWRQLEYLRDTEELNKKLAEFWGTH